MYSIRPYPRGWALSGGRPASFAPTIVRTLDRASLRLFTASDTTATEWAAVPTAAFTAASSTFVKIPMTLVLMMIRSRSDPVPFSMLSDLRSPPGPSGPVPLALPKDTTAPPPAQEAGPPRPRPGTGYVSIV